MSDPASIVFLVIESTQNDRGGAPFETLAAAAAMLEWPLPRERDEAVCDEAARLVDALLARVARARGAIEIAIGEGLDALGRGDGTLRLGYAGTGDYARERLGIPASTAVKMARLARQLRDRPVLRAAVWSGEVTARAAHTILTVARGDDEADWVALARSRSIRWLRKAVQEPRDEADERWVRIRVSLSSEQRATLNEAMDLAGKLLGAAAPRWQRLEAIAEEYLGAHAAGAEHPNVSCDAAPAGDALQTLEEWLETESAQWAFLDRVEAVAAPPLHHTVDPRALDTELRRLSGLRDRWDQVFGHLALVFRALKGWRRLSFASFDHYCAERLGMAGRTVEQRAVLERRLHEVPALASAMREGTLSYEKARLLSLHVDVAAMGTWIERAAGMTCIGLRRALEDLDEAQMCAQGDFAVFAPQRLGTLLGDACQLARKVAGSPIAMGECLQMVAQHFIDTWGPALRERPTLQKEVLARDRDLCQVPGCSRAAVHAHHIVYRSRGGADEEANLVSLCAAHHLHGVHRGYVGISGEAPHGLRWRLGA